MATKEQMANTLERRESEIAKLRDELKTAQTWIAVLENKTALLNYTPHDPLWWRRNERINSERRTGAVESLKDVVVWAERNESGKMYSHLTEQRSKRAVGLGMLINGLRFDGDDILLMAVVALNMEGWKPEAAKIKKMYNDNKTKLGWDDMKV